MSVTISISTALRRFADNLDELVVNAGHVESALAEAARHHPKLGAQLFTEDGRVRGFILVFVNGRNIKHLQQQQTQLTDGDRISLVPAIAGG